jgi:thiamine biosynthesis lipoprotein
VGAIAKGWAVQQVAQSAPKGLLISVGGNVCATGPKDTSGTPWVVAIQSIDDSNDYLHTLSIKTGCVVTSGDYQRTYTVDGTMYHHIIDPETLYPSVHWRSVTIVCDDSGAADALSTALFLLPQAEGQALLDLFHAEALWVNAAGEKFYSPGFKALIKS